MIVKAADMSDEQYGLLFDVLRSIRYHDRRRAFFDVLHRSNSALVILLAGSVVFDLAKPGESPWWMVALALVASLLSIMDLVIGYSTASNRHSDLKRRFAELEIAIRSGGEDELTWASHHTVRVRIEQDEPPIYRVLDLLCYQEVCRSLGMYDRADSIEVCWFKRLTRHLHHWSDVRIAGSKAV